MDLRKKRDLALFIVSLLFCWIYIPHIAMYLISNNKPLIRQDLVQLSNKINIRINNFLILLYLLHNDPYFRTVFYHRIGAIPAFFISWWRPGCRYFTISKTTIIDGGILYSHPFSTIINAVSIGKNFSFRHLTTLGNKGSNANRPTIGDNVTLGASVTIIGKIRIGNNVVIGAGSVVTKSIPDNCVSVGNPARVIKKKESKI
jgi:serine O-acetyltransferase